MNVPEPTRLLTIACTSTGSENQPPSSRIPPTSRPKIRCFKRKPRSDERRPDREALVPIPPSERGNTGIHEPQPQPRPMRPNRPKRKCTFGPNSHKAKNQTNQHPGHPISPTESHPQDCRKPEDDELEELLKEIDEVRINGCELFLEETEDSDNSPDFIEDEYRARQTRTLDMASGSRPTSRPKVKCTFGPKHKDKQLPEVSALTVEDAGGLWRSPHRDWTRPWPTHSSPSFLLGPRTSIDTRAAIGSRTRAYPESDRVTLEMPGLSYRHSPLNRYKSMAEPPLNPSPISLSLGAWASPSKSSKRPSRKRWTTTFKLSPRNADSPTFHRMAQSSPRITGFATSCVTESL